MEQSQKEQLARKIWITRKCRINASERLLSDAKYFELLNVYIYGRKKLNTEDVQTVDSLFKDAMFKEVQQLEHDIQNFS